MRLLLIAVVTAAMAAGCGGDESSTQVDLQAKAKPDSPPGLSHRGRPENPGKHLHAGKPPHAGKPSEQEPPSLRVVGPGGETSKVLFLSQYSSDTQLGVNQLPLTLVVGGTVDPANITWHSSNPEVLAVNAGSISKGPGGVPGQVLVTATDTASGLSSSIAVSSFVDITKATGLKPVAWGTTVLYPSAVHIKGEFIPETDASPLIATVSMVLEETGQELCKTSVPSEPPSDIDGMSYRSFAFLCEFNSSLGMPPPTERVDYTVSQTITFNQRPVDTLYGFVKKQATFSVRPPDDSTN